MMSDFGKSLLAGIRRLGGGLENFEEIDVKDEDIRTGVLIWQS